jgi:hypothetical protein
MSDFLRGRNMGWDLPADNQMFILSNDNNQYGSAAMMIPGIIKSFSEREAVDKVVILPSSTHEVLLLPVYEQGTYDVSALVSLVRQVNSTEVSSDEILSDKVYIYERQNDDIRICREDELF